VTFYWDYSGTFAANETINVTGLANSSYFNRTNLALEKTIVWNCYACNINNKCAYSFSNHSVVITSLADKTKLLYENFESGSFATNKWTLNSTIAVNAKNWTIITTDPYQGVYHAEANPTNIIEPAAVMEVNASTEGYTNLTFVYYRKLIEFDPSDEFQVKWWNGTNWTILENTPDTVNDLDYYRKNFTLPVLAENNPDFKIRFECTAGATNEYCRVDEISLRADYLPVEPNISRIYPTATVNLNEGPSLTGVVVNFSVYDSNLAANLNDASARVNFTRSGEALRENLSCISTQKAGRNANYSCIVPMYWFDSAGEWNATVSITDNDGKTHSAVINFSVNALTGFVVDSSIGGWGNMTADETNKTFSGYITLNNTGNQNISLGNVQVNATDLVGEEESLYRIYANNFSIGVISGGECGGTSLNKSGFVSISGSLLPRGNYTVNDGETGQERLYLCIRELGGELRTQAYSTAAEGSWTIKILLVVFTAAGAAGARKRKKSRKLLGELEKIEKELRKSNLLERAETIKTAISEIQEKISLEGRGVVEARVIPITIFSREVGALEVLVRYLKENVGMTYHEIAIELSRDDRTVWTAHHKAVEKSKEQIRARETKIYVPLEIFKDRNKTVLEATIVYLREKGMRFNEIAELVDRDQRNVWTIYSRATKK
jgi:hypothetical protein